MYPVHTKNVSPAISNSSDLKIVFEETRFRDGSIGGPSSVAIKHRFQISQTKRGRSLEIEILS